MAKNWISGATANHKGSFKRAAHTAGMSTQEYASKVTSNPGKYSSTTVKRANLAKTLMNMRKG